MLQLHLASCNVSRHSSVNIHDGQNEFQPDMLAPAMIPVQLVNMTANTVAKDVTEFVL